jgi:hypothetical protein
VNYVQYLFNIKYKYILLVGVIFSRYGMHYIVWWEQMWDHVNKFVQDILLASNFKDVGNRIYIGYKYCYYTSFIIFHTILLIEQLLDMELWHKKFGHIGL